MKPLVITRQSLRLLAAILCAGHFVSNLSLPGHASDNESRHEPGAHASDKKSKPERGALASAQIRAPQAVVWSVIVNAKEFDSTIEGESVDGAVVEQRFTKLPVFGQMAVTFKVTVVPQERLDFKMVRSNCMKDFSGRWLVTPIDDSTTRVDMRCFVDPGLAVPQFIVNQFLSGKLRKRLLKIKKLAEAAAPKQP